MQLSPKLAIGSIVLIALMAYLGAHIFYYEHSKSPEELAEKLIENNRSAGDCFLFRTFDIGPRPTTYEMQMRCVREYASLTKDPTACELLLPSSYGWSCLGVATDHRACVMLMSGEVRGNGMNAQWKECVTGSEEIKSNACCKVALAAKVENINDCNSLDSQPRFYDECQYRVALKNRDSKYCETINSENLKSACLIGTKAMQANPSICEGCSSKIKNVDELFR
ncbi:hypothetical protein KJ652_06555 [Patescibacteria group bacterium]|nr:hypothetical protein [Patescibacteria group bacterium]MBU1124212.1 hypothetical protein [Patescibacteria group bacterium]MBU1911301.1 hypothetical protein [Patescibacteria group bacterium]